MLIKQKGSLSTAICEEDVNFFMEEIFMLTKMFFRQDKKQNLLLKRQSKNLGSFQNLKFWTL